jgi:hypothetical protein
VSGRMLFRQIILIRYQIPWSSEEGMTNFCMVLGVQKVFTDVEALVLILYFYLKI